MAGIFSAADVVLAAQQIEIRGEIFYTRLTETAATPELKKMFTFLASEEARHREIFRKLSARLDQVEIPAWAGEDEYVQYLKYLLDSHTLFQLGDVQQVRQYTGTTQEALSTAMGFEKDTIMFFLEMSQFVPASERTYIQTCIDEERSHLRLLAGMRRDLGK